VADTNRGFVLGAALCIVSATFITWAAATNSPSMHVPPAIAYCIALIFAAVAFRLVQLRANAQSAGDGFAFIVFAAATAVEGWIAFGHGPRVCAQSANNWISTQSGGLGCRVPFGIGAAICASLAVYCVVRLARARRAGQGL
jgi:hypothetical protein